MKSNKNIPHTLVGLEVFICVNEISHFLRVWSLSHRCTVIFLDLHLHIPLSSGSRCPRFGLGFHLRRPDCLAPDNVVLIAYAYRHSFRHACTASYLKGL